MTSRPRGLAEVNRRTVRAVVRKLRHRQGTAERAVLVNRWVPEVQRERRGHGLVQTRVTERARLAQLVRRLPVRRVVLPLVLVEQAQAHTDGERAERAAERGERATTRAGTRPSHTAGKSTTATGNAAATATDRAGAAKLGDRRQHLDDAAADGGDLQDLDGLRQGKGRNGHFRDLRVRVGELDQPTEHRGHGLQFARTESAGRLHQAHDGSTGGLQ